MKLPQAILHNNKKNIHSVTPPTLNSSYATARSLCKIHIIIRSPKLQEDAADLMHYS